MNANEAIPAKRQQHGPGTLALVSVWLSSIWNRPSIASILHLKTFIFFIVLAAWCTSIANALAADPDCRVNVRAFFVDEPGGRIGKILTSDPNDPDSTNTIIKAGCGGSVIFFVGAGSCWVPSSTVDVTETHFPSTSNLFKVTNIYQTNIYNGGASTNITTYIKYYDFEEGLCSITVSISASGSCTLGGTGTGGLQFTIDLSASSCSACKQSQPGTSSTDNSCLDFKVRLGLASVLYDAGYLALHADVPSSNLSTPAALAYPIPSLKVSVLTNSQGIKQVLTPICLATVSVTVTNYEYQLQLFSSNNITGQSGGFYTTGTNTPFVTYVIRNPDTSNAFNRLIITELRSGVSNQHQYTYSNTNGQLNRWDLLRPDGTTVSKWAAADTNDATITNYYFVITDTNNTIVKQRIATVMYLASINGIITNSIVEGTNGVTETTTFTHYPTNAATGANLMRRIDYPDGNWVYYAYDSAMRVTNEYSAYNNSAPPNSVTDQPDVASNHCKLVVYDYSDISGTINSGSNIFVPKTTRVILPAQSGTNWSAQEVSRTYRFSTVTAIEERQCTVPGASWDSTGNLTNITVLYKFPNLTDGLFTPSYRDGQVHSVSHPDGTATVYDYTKTSSNLTVTESVGEPMYYTNFFEEIVSCWGLNWQDPIYDGSDMVYEWNILNGSRTITVTDQLGRIQSRTVKVLTNGTEGATLAYDSYLYLTNDPLGRNFILMDLAGRATTNLFECCGLGIVKDPDGVETDYEYDSMKRLSTITERRGTNSIVTTQVYDALGRSAKVTRTGTDNTLITLNQTLYDIFGRALKQTNALGGTNAIVSTIAGDQLTTTTTYSDNGTRIELFYRDGNPQSVTGTAVFPARYTNFVDSDGGYYRLIRQEVKLATNGSDTSEWAKTYLDAAGREYKTVYSAASNAPTFYQYYNSKGQLTYAVDPDGVSMIYAYNKKGEREYFVVDMDRDTNIDWNGSDRITFTTNDVATDNGTIVTRTRTYAWKVNNSNTSNLVSTVETSLNGLTNWTTIWNNGSAVTTSNWTCYAASGIRYVTNMAADGSYSFSTFQYGRLLSVTNKDSGSNTINSVTYAYDAHGRRNLITDARTGTTTNFFNSMDLVNGVVSPVPGVGQSSQVTSNFFDTMGRITTNLLSDGTSVTNEYYPTGLIKRKYGSREYPVGYGYDSQGRMTKMTNWTAFASGTGARITTWNYDAYRGWLSSKVYDDDKGTLYTNTDAGLLKSRLWGRGTNSAYTYNNAGGLATAIYNDGTTAGITNGYDRVGRQTTISNGAIATTLTYNDAGKLINETNSGGVMGGISITNGYDSLLRRTTLSVLTNGVAIVTITNNYDAAGRLLRLGNGVNVYAYSNLANSRLISQILFTNDGSLRMTMTKRYDNLNRLTGITNINASSIVLDSHQYGYNAANQRVALTNLNGTYWHYGYDALGQVTAGTNRWTGDNSIVAGRQFSYAFDDIGNRTSSAFGGDSSRNNMRTVNYVANNLNQYTSRTNPGYFEVTGEANSVAVVTVNGNSAYRKNDYFWQELTVTNSSAAVWLGVTNSALLPPGPNGVLQGNQFVPKNAETYSYDNDGNQTQDGRWTCTWDAENRLISMLSLTNTPTASKYRIGFGYDYKGRRITKKAESFDGTNWSVTVSNLFVYDGWNLVAELNATNKTLIRSYTWGTDLSGSMQGAGGVGGLLSITVHTGTNAGTYYPCYDGNGNVMAMINAADGTVVANYEYGPFGETISVIGPMASMNPFRWSTKYQDDESDFVYYGNRYLKNSTGGWLSRDPIEELGGLNLYSLAKNDSVDTVDLLGQTPIIDRDKKACKINVSLRIYVWTKDSSVSLNQVIPRIQNSIGKEWNAGKWILDGWTITFGSTVTTKPTTTSPKSRPPAAPGDEIEITNGNGNDTVSETGPIGLDSGQWSQNAPDWAFAHEAGHLMGLPDDYTAQTDPATGKRTGTFANPGHSGHMMADSFGAVVEHEVRDIVGKLTPCSCTKPTTK